MRFLIFSYLKETYFASPKYSFPAVNTDLILKFRMFTQISFSYNHWKKTNIIRKSFRNRLSEAIM